MQEFPHHYKVTARGELEGDIELASGRLEPIQSAGPAEFGGPGNRWSPETLFAAAIADCFILTFRAIARASNLSWINLSCEAECTLDRVDRVTRFTRNDVRASLVIPSGVNPALAERLLEKAEKDCLITNSLSGESRFERSVSISS